MRWQTEQMQKVVDFVKNMVQGANFVSYEVFFTAKFYCLKDDRTFKRKEKPGLRLSKDVLPVSAMKVII